MSWGGPWECPLHPTERCWSPMTAPAWCTAFQRRNREARRPTSRKLNYQRPSPNTSSGLTGLLPSAKHCALLRPEPLPICARGDAGMSLEERAEKGDILITDGVANLLHGAMVAFEQTLAGRDAELLQIDQRTVSRGLLKAANEIAQAHAHAPGWGFERKAVVKVLVQPLLRAGDAVVAMLRL